MRVPTGRYEKRTERAVTVEVLRLHESQLNSRAVTQNVSPRGARIVTDCNCTPGRHVLVTALEEGVKSLARVVYCQRVESTKFAVGLQLVVRVEEWGNAASVESPPIEKSFRQLRSHDSVLSFRMEPHAEQRKEPRRIDGR
jgi:hypothetical protein